MIKTCPFCNSKAVVKEFKRSKTEMIGVLTDRVLIHSLPSQFYVKCPNKDCNGCQPQTKFFDTKEQAISSCNERVIDNG